MPPKQVFPELATVCRLPSRLNEAAIPYAFLGPMAANLHGAPCYVPSVEVLLTGQGLDHFRQDLVGRAYRHVAGRLFVDCANGMAVRAKLTGRSPGRDRPHPLTFPDPQTVGTEVGGVRVLPLAELIQLNLGEGRFRHLAAVVALIDRHGLGESFLMNMHPSVHRDFIRCLEEKRREDAFNAHEECEMLATLTRSASEARPAVARAEPR
jgi:hypothetical protein